MDMARWGRNAAADTVITSMDQHGTPTIQSALRELFELLEDYAPTWYTEEHHNRAIAALGEMAALPAVH